MTDVIVFNDSPTPVVMTQTGETDFTVISAGGPRGPQGLPGDVGPAGPPGDTGPQGEPGPEGAQGPQGDVGPQGDTGPAGPQGIQGVAGPAGPEGPQGPQGAEGPEGPQGQGLTIIGTLNDPSELPLTGFAGDAYLISGDLWVWSESTTEWVNTGSIQGPAGPQGPQGIQGVEGPAGPQGPQGDPGLAGADGAVGPQGPQGDPGPAGPTGPQGIQGPAGPQGDVGATGPAGPQGDVGPQGPQGDPGGAVVLDDLTDVDVTTTPPTDGQALVWVDVDSLWKPGSVAAEGGGAAEKYVSGRNLDAEEISNWGDSTNPSATKGIIVRAVEDGVVTAASGIANWVADRTYRMGLYRLDDALVVDEVQTSTFVAPAGTARRAAGVTGVEWAVQRDRLYLLAATDFSGAGSLALPSSQPTTTTYGTGTTALLDSVANIFAGATTSIAVGYNLPVSGTVFRNYGTPYVFGWEGRVAGGAGATGAQGPAGPEGPAGPQGDTGPAGPEGPQGPEGPPGATTLDGLTDVDLTTPPTTGQALVYDGAVWSADDVAGGGGSPEAGTMVWTGDYDSGTTYEYGDVARTADGLFVALTTVTGQAPSLPVDTFIDTFNRADGAVGPNWDVVETGWVISGNKARNTDTTSGRMLVKNLTTDGTVTVTGLNRPNSLNGLGVVFARVDANNYYRLWFANDVRHLQKVVGGAAPVNLANFPSYNIDATINVVLTKAGGVITAQAGGESLEYTDPSPLNGTGWGVVHGTYGGTGDTKVDEFQFVPAASPGWAIIERKWALDSLTDVQAPSPVDGEMLGFDADTGLWVAVPPGTGPEGPQGPAGPQGETGPAGPQGDAGATGATGPEGPAGPQGDPGATTLVGLTDVDLDPMAADGDVLEYDTGTSTWLPVARTDGLWKAWTGTQAAYDGLGSYDPDTLYVVIG